MNNELLRPEPPPPPLYSAQAGQSLSGREILDTLFRQKWRILSLWSLVLATTLGYMFFVPPHYETEMTLLVKDKRVDLSLAGNGGDRPDSVATDTQLATEIQLLSSRELLRMVAIQAGLASAKAPAEVDRAVANLKRDIRISPVLKSSLIQVRYSDTSPQRSARVLQLLAGLYMDMHLQLHSSPGSFEFFSKQAEDYERKLRDAHNKLLDFQGRTHIVLLPEQRDLTLRKMLDLESSLRDAQAQKNETELRICKLREQMAGLGGRVTTQVRKIPNQYSYERFNTLLAELQNKRTEMLTKFRPDDRMVKQIDQQIVDTRKSLGAVAAGSSTEEATDLNPIRQAVEGELGRSEVALSGLNARIAALGQQIGGLRADLSRLENAAPDDQILMREVNEAEQNFILYSKKREEARIAQELDRQKIANVVMVDPPRVPSAARSKMSSGAPAGFVLGSICVLALCFAWGHRRNVVHTPWELEASVGLPVLATIPLNGKPLLPGPMRRQPVLEIEGRVGE